ncbi:putative secreted hydrolase [Marinobacter nitratireducens]|uniref:Putative secreted hydrolase n=1 Tax=Marinobacter nitratireducens TaxID=1137280 RepID=A0A072N882_9GAMM|nr:SGNH/GDSL hydrolase family protein [Marinobacter nitratireducens]KEF33173.1 putative secreted hydrolase [Marinobacter nitratireducens]
MQNKALSTLILLLAGLVTSFTVLAAKPVPTIYAALGDSYAAGNGTGTRDLAYSCYRSSDAYGPLIEKAHRKWNLDFEACSGATSDDVINSQLSPLSADTNYVTVSMGGNDIGFAELILNCAMYWDQAQCLAKVDEVHARIDSELPAKLEAAYAAINAAAPNAKVIQLGYPRAFGNNLACWDARGVSSTEAQALNGVSDHLDQVIGGRAAMAGVTYLSVIEQFKGHDMCSSEPYIRGKSGVYLEDWFHPTAAGHASGFKPLIEAAMK